MKLLFDNTLFSKLRYFQNILTQIKPKNCKSYTEKINKALIDTGYREKDALAIISLNNIFYLI